MVIYIHYKIYGEKSEYIQCIFFKSDFLVLKFNIFTYLILFIICVLSTTTFERKRIFMLFSLILILPLEIRQLS